LSGFEPISLPLMKLVDPNDPFYRPYWRRLLIVLVVALWCGTELLYARDGLWTVLAAGVLAFCVWTFIVDWKGGSQPPAT
jgi:hypothetical protein